MKHSPAQLQYIAKISPGYPFRGKIEEAPGSGLKAVQMKDVSPESGIQWNDCIEAELPGKRDPEWLKPVDILVAARGSHNYAVLVGEGASSGKAVAAPQFFVINSIGSNIDPSYLEFVLNHGPCQTHFKREAEGTHTKSIRRSVLEAIQIPVPSLDKQRSIVALAQTIHRERSLAQSLIQNGASLLNALASNLHRS